MPLLKVFADVAKYHFFDRWKERPQLSPALELEKSCNISGISQEYTIPEGRTRASIESDYSEYLKRRIHGIIPAVLFVEDIRQIKSLLRKSWEGTLSEEYWENKMAEDAQELIALNPILEAIQCDFSDPDNQYHFVFGVTSGFNIDDIQYFLDCQSNARGVEEGFYASRALEEQLDIDIGWIPSPKTIEKITKAIQVRDLKFNSNAPHPSAHSMSPDR